MDSGQIITTEAPRTPSREFFPGRTLTSANSAALRLNSLFLCGLGELGARQIRTADCSLLTADWLMIVKSVSGKQ
jgi:hypothetical protein